MLILCLLWLVAAGTGQPLSSPDGGCAQGWECIKQRQCPPFLDQKDRLEHLEKAIQLVEDEDVRSEYLKLSGKLKELVCNKAQDGVCCKEQLEIANGNVVERVEDMPYMVRLVLKESLSGYSRCGASLIGSQFLLLVMVFDMPNPKSIQCFIDIDIFQNPLFNLFQNLLRGVNPCPVDLVLF